ncbi:SDR family oxidoreductase [Halarcobacter sp.]|uniref:SDR family oxidoreductase n=1 Tax=Halarcobacter sp. TaxID=2321133 RepID=UPI0029F49491|nr:SDR family oxidoreductase [Halarcobacter sp.]
MNICLVGATGYLGQHLAKEMNSRKINPIILTRRWNEGFDSIIKTKYVYQVDFTNPASLSQKLHGVDIVISTLGITRQKDNLTYMDVDYQANLNILNEAINCGVKKFIYISALNGDKLKNIKIFEAKEKFVEQLKKSNLEYLIIRPNGFYSDMKDFLQMADSGRVYLFGKGDKKLNPIDGTDLAKFCLDSIDLKNQELEVGGPIIYSHKEVANLAFKILNKKPEITYLPDFLRKFILKILPIFLSSKTYGPIEFFLSVMGIDMIAPKEGKYTLESFYKNEIKKSPNNI